MKYVYLFLLCLLIVLSMCFVFPNNAKNEPKRSGGVYCDGAGQGMRFKDGNVRWLPNGALSVITEDGLVVETNFPCAIIYDKE